jgi:hypothetical protein
MKNRKQKTENRNKSHQSQKIIDWIENLPLIEKLEVIEGIAKKYSYTYISEPSITVKMSRGMYDIFWLLPGVGLVEEGSEYSTEFPDRDVELFRKIQFLVQTFQKFLLGEEGIQRYIETEEDRKLVKALEHGAKIDLNTGEVVDPITGEKI